MRHIVSSSNGVSLHFPDGEEALYKEHCRTQIRIAVETYAKLRHKNGIWATNQDKFVPLFANLNYWDSKKMENLYVKWLRGEL